MGFTFGNKLAVVHGYSYHPVYKIWRAIKQRCYNPKDTAYKNYGMRGIKICEEWLKNPVTFCEWAIANGWKKDLVFDRTNNNGNYEPNNCRFVTKELSLRNKRLLSKRNTSGYRGVTWHKKRKQWRSRIVINSKQIHLGLFKTPQEAALIWDKCARQLNDGRPLNNV